MLHQEEEVLAAKFWEISEETMCDGCNYDRRATEACTPYPSIPFIRSNTRARACVPFFPRPMAFAAM